MDSHYWLIPILSASLLPILILSLTSTLARPCRGVGAPPSGGPMGHSPTERLLFPANEETAIRIRTNEKPGRLFRTPPPEHTSSHTPAECSFLGLAKQPSLHMVRKRKSESDDGLIVQLKSIVEGPTRQQKPILQRRLAHQTQRK